MRKSSLLSVFFIFMAVVGLVHASSKTADVTPVNRAIIVNVNHRNFEITMQANRTTGYDWYLSSSPASLILKSSCMDGNLSRKAKGR